jgi:hypothetical protein
LSVNAFKQKYFALPGDMPNATDFWGSASGATCFENTSATGSGTETCNGNGDGYISISLTIADSYTEMYMFWQHLANAGLIKGTYSGKAGNVSRDDSIVGVNVPVSDMSGAGWSIIGHMVPDSGPNANNSHYGRNHAWPLIMGSEYRSREPFNPVITTAEAWNIDTKIDDGNGREGKVVQERIYNADCRTGTEPYYALDNDAINCTLIFMQ